MIRLFISFLVAGLVFFPALAAEAEMNSTEYPGEFVIRECAIISFDEAKNPDSPGNSTQEANLTKGAVNQTRRGGDLSARKLYELRQAARDDLRMMGNNESRELSVGLSPTAAQSIAIVCKQCVPESQTG